MTEEIIIDGVNVAGCVQLQEELTYPCGLGGTCEGWDNCYYKQLQRLKQENAELKKERDIVLGQLVINDGEDVTVQISQSQFEQYNNFRKALEEIREIAMGIMDEDTEETSCYYDANAIINKINEVLQ